ncbi:hypothetical protein WA1_04980 [Scytonema hofmannii PCC 7110]|uniref:Uncharacterized protein n=1 Tax=Scytonema hofmannii PCC 7110 TaxID=128403 RepID=A0A139WZL7_9CYAN|nr:hypothetical protein [Scytonema hofmannii]KYC37860.1 hypothetical protein WA1_04980 [Scytonema hofmannii PCC 7110]
MITIISDVEKLRYLDPQQVETYLRSHGWHQQQPKGDKADLWTLDDFEILLPLKPEIVDFKRRMAEVLETLALAENRSQIEIFSSLVTNAPNITIQGLVTHIETPFADKMSGEIMLFGVVVDRLRPIKTELVDRDYIIAIKAYQERLPVLCTGDLIKENGIFILKNSCNFQLDSNSQ